MPLFEDCQLMFAIIFVPAVVWHNPSIWECMVIPLNIRTLYALKDKVLINCYIWYLSDVMEDAPDKKSIMIYLMCCLQVLEKGNRSALASSLGSEAVQPAHLDSDKVILNRILDYIHDSGPLLYKSLCY